MVPKNSHDVSSVEVRVRCRVRVGVRVRVRVRVGVRVRVRDRVRVRVMVRVRLTCQRSSLVLFPTQLYINGACVLILNSYTNGIHYRIRHVSEYRCYGLTTL